MKVIVAGSRSIEDRSLVRDVLDEMVSEWDVDTIIHGGADGVDKQARFWGLRNSLKIDNVEGHPIPEWAWEMIGKKCGPLRNKYMARQGDSLVAIWDGESAGTKNMIKQAESMGLRVRKVVCEDQSDDGESPEWHIVSDEIVDEDQRKLGDY